MTTTEEWRLVPSLPEYEASSWGRVRRIEYYGPMPHGGLRKYGGVAWVGTWAKKEGRFTMNFRGKTYRIARMVCEAFHGPAPFPDAIAMHKDEDARHNREDNLRWSTQKENLPLKNADVKWLGS